MREAIRLSLSRMRANRGGPFGAVVVRKGKIVARGWNRIVTPSLTGTIRCGVPAGM